MRMRKRFGSSAPLRAAHNVINLRFHRTHSIVMFVDTPLRYVKAGKSSKAFSLDDCRWASVCCCRAITSLHAEQLASAIRNVLLPVGISLRPNGHFMSSKAVDATTASGHWRPCEHQEVGSAIISRPGSTEALTPRRISRLPAGTVTNRRAGGTRTSTGLCCSHVSVEPRFQDGGKRWRTFEHGATGKLAESSLASRRAP